MAGGTHLQVRRPPVRIAHQKTTNWHQWHVKHGKACYMVSAVAGSTMRMRQRPWLRRWGLLLWPAIVLLPTLCSRRLYSLSDQYIFYKHYDVRLQCVAVCCSALQCVALRCSVLQCETACCNIARHQQRSTRRRASAAHKETTNHHSASQRTAVRCSALQDVAVRDSTNSHQQCPARR